MDSGFRRLVDIGHIECVKELQDIMFVKQSRLNNMLQCLETGASRIKRLEQENAELKKMVEQMETLLQEAIEDWAERYNHEENPQHGSWAARAGSVLNTLQAAKGAKNNG
jgi:DNA phosphorothioation-dependent restriction protein DptG